MGLLIRTQSGSLLPFTFLLNIQTKRPYWRILARGRDGTNRAQLGTHKSYVGQNYLPPTFKQAKLVSDLVDSTLDQTYFVLICRLLRTKGMT